MIPITALFENSDKNSEPDKTGEPEKFGEPDKNGEHDKFGEPDKPGKLYGKGLFIIDVMHRGGEGVLAKSYFP